MFSYNYLNRFIEAKDKVFDSKQQSIRNRFIHFTSLSENGLIY